jgi:hypothetical protein
MILESSGAGSLEAMINDTARKHGVAAELLARAVDRLGLADELEEAS